MQYTHMAYLQCGLSDVQWMYFKFTLLVHPGTTRNRILLQTLISMSRCCGHEFTFPHQVHITLCTTLLSCLHFHSPGLSTSPYSSLGLLLITQYVCPENGCHIESESSTTQTLIVHTRRGSLDS